MDNNLTYEFTANTNAGLTSDVHVSGSMSLIVTSGSSVVCTIEIVTPQTDNGTTYKDLGGTSGVEVTANATNVQSRVEGGALSCGTSTTNQTSGITHGTIKMHGKDALGNAAAISVDVP